MDVAPTCVCGRGRAEPVRAASARTPTSQAGDSRAPAHPDRTRVDHRIPAVSVADPAWLEELFAYLRIPSVSADPARAADVEAACEWVCDFVRGAGGSCEIRATSTHPLVLGEIP